MNKDEKAVKIASEVISSAKIINDVFRTTAEQIERHIRLPHEEAIALSDNLNLCQSEIRPDRDRSDYSVVTVSGIADELIMKDVFYAGLMFGYNKAAQDVKRKLNL